MLNVPHIKQEEKEWCGPAVMQMVLRYFGVQKSQTELARRLGTTVEHGTDEEMMEKVGRDLGFDVQAGQGTYQKIIDAVEAGIPVIVGFIEPVEDDGHYSIVTEVNEHIRLLDPEEPTEPEIILSKDEFMKRWRSKYTMQQQWMLVMKPFGK